MALSRHLREFADNLAPTESFLFEARQATGRVQDVLHQTRGLSIDRIVPLGSYGKKTSQGRDVDVDLHVFFNDEVPPFSQSRSTMATALRSLDMNLRVGEHAIQMKVDGIDFDVVSAANMVDKYTRREGSVAEKQIENVLYFLKCKAGPHVDKKRDYSTSLSEGAVEFEKRHSAFSHAMSRLAKFWASNLATEHEPEGKSSIMEYLGARAAEDEEASGSQDMLSAFRRFLDIVKRPQSIFVYWECCYREADIPADIMRQRPLLLDPTNPYDNFLQGVSQAFYNDLRCFAEQMLTDLDDAERRRTVPAMFTDHTVAKIHEDKRAFI